MDPYVCQAIKINGIACSNNAKREYEYLYCGVHKAEYYKKERKLISPSPPPSLQEEKVINNEMVTFPSACFSYQGKEYKIKYLDYFRYPVNEHVKIHLLDVLYVPLEFLRKKEWLMNFFTERFIKPNNGELYRILQDYSSVSYSLIRAFFHDVMKIIYCRLREGNYEKEAEEILLLDKNLHGYLAIAN